MRPCFCVPLEGRARIDRGKELQEITELNMREIFLAVSMIQD